MAKSLLNEDRLDPKLGGPVGLNGGSICVAKVSECIQVSEEDGEGRNGFIVRYGKLTVASGPLTICRSALCSPAMHDHLRTVSHPVMFAVSTAGLATASLATASEAFAIGARSILSFWYAILLR